MAIEANYEGPSNIVGFNKYMDDKEQRVSTGSVQEQQWYIARVINPESETIDHYAADILLRVLRVSELKDGAIKVYARPVGQDGAKEPGEDDAATMNGEGYFFKENKERGYLLDVFKNHPKNLGSLAAASVVVH